MTIGRYQRTNRPTPIIGRLSVHLYSQKYILTVKPVALAVLV